MENMFTQIIGEKETNKFNLLSENKLKAEKILNDLKAIIPLDSTQLSGYNSFHIGKMGNPINCSSQSQIQYSINDVSFFGLILILYPQRELFVGYTYQNLLDEYRDKNAFGGSSSSHYPIRIDLSNAKGLKVAYWLIKKEILEIRK